MDFNIPSPLVLRGDKLAPEESGSGFISSSHSEHMHGQPIREPLSICAIRTYGGHRRENTKDLTLADLDHPCFAWSTVYLNGHHSAMVAVGEI